jgi:hypothetical protein
LRCRARPHPLAGCPPANDKKGIIEEVAYAEYFLPTHQEIAMILKTKIHLIEGGEVPEQLLEYIDHFTSENLANRLKQNDIDVWSEVKPFPEEFFEHLRQDRKLVFARYQEALQELRSGLLSIPEEKAEEIDD